jgi:phospholipid/cholesterol/gamma-HCH transport system substrate-binding protein
METRVAYAAVGAFVLALSGLFIALALWLGSSFSQTVYTQYQILTRDSVSGLSVGSPVKFLGVQVGSVKSIDLANAEQVRIILNVNVATPVKTDTVATLTSQGITGLSLIELSGGTADAPLLTTAPKTGEYPTIATRPSLLRRLDVAVSRTLDSVDQIAGEVKNVLNDQNQAELAKILSNLALVTETMAQERAQIAQVLENSVRATASADKALARAPEVMDELNKTLIDVRRMTASFEQTSGRFGKLSDTLQSATTHTQEEIQLLRRSIQPQINLLLTQSTSTTRAIETLATEIKRDPSSLIRGAPVQQPGPGER